MQTQFFLFFLGGGLAQRTSDPCWTPCNAGSAGAVVTPLAESPKVLSAIREKMQAIYICPKFNQKMAIKVETVLTTLAFQDTCK